MGSEPACAPRPPPGSHGRSAHPARGALALGGSADDGRSDCGWPLAAQVGLPEAGPLSVTTVLGPPAYRALETRSGRQPGPGTRGQLRASPGAAPRARGGGAGAGTGTRRVRAGRRGQVRARRERAAGVRGGRRGSGEARPVSAPECRRVPVALPGGVSPLQLSPGLAATPSASSVATW